jgi:hypothetical protein
MLSLHRSIEQMLDWTAQKNGLQRQRTLLIDLFETKLIYHL